MWSLDADCKHELRPVQSGFRLALVYNNLNLSTGPDPQLNHYSRLVADITREVKDWALQVDLPDQGIYMLAHK